MVSPQGAKLGPHNDGAPTELMAVTNLSEVGVHAPAVSQSGRTVFTLTLIVLPRQARDDHRTS